MDSRRRLPEWLIGLILAVVLVVAGFFLLDALGAGDDPGFEESGAAPAVVGYGSGLSRAA